MAKVKVTKKKQNKAKNPLVDLMKSMGVDTNRMLKDPNYAQQLMGQYKNMLGGMNAEEMQQMLKTSMEMLKQYQEAMPVLAQLGEVLKDMNESEDGGEADDSEAGEGATDADEVGGGETDDTEGGGEKEDEEEKDEEI